MGRRTRQLLVMIAVAATFVVGVPPGTSVAGAAPADPVIIVAGTFSPAFANEPLAARLRADGYRAYIFELPGLGTGDIAASAAALDSFADAVRADTGAAKVDLVGHSQGGLVGRQYIKFNGGAAEVDSMISLGAPHYGTYLANFASFFGTSVIGLTSINQMSIGSSFLNNLNAGDDTIASVRYTNFFTNLDELVRPVSNATLNDGATNVRIQSQCWLRVVGHLGLIVDGTVYSGVADALAKRPIWLNCFAL